MKISPIPLHQIPEFWWKSKNLKSGIKCRHFKMQLVEGINKCQHDGFLWIIARNMISRLCKVKMTRIKEVSSTCYHLIFNTIKFCEINEKIKYPLKAIYTFCQSMCLYSAYIIFINIQKNAVFGINCWQGSFKILCQLLFLFLPFCIDKMLFYNAVLFPLHIEYYS